MGPYTMLLKVLLLKVNAAEPIDVIPALQILAGKYIYGATAINATRP